MKIVKFIFTSPAVLAAGVIAVVVGGVMIVSVVNNQDSLSDSTSKNEPTTTTYEDSPKEDTQTPPEQEVSYETAYTPLNELISPSNQYLYYPVRRAVATTTTSPTPATPTATPEPTVTPEPEPVYYTVTRTGAYKYTPAEVEAGVAAANPAYFTRSGNVFNTTLKAGTYGGGYSQPGDYFYLNELYYQINFSSSLTFLNIGTQLTYKNQTIDFYVDDVLAIQWVLVEETNNPGTEFYVTKQYNLDPDYLWHTGAYGQVQGGPYVFDPVDIALQYSCSGC